MSNFPEYLFLTSFQQIQDFTKLSKSKISLKKDGTIEFEALENANTFKRFYSELAGGLQEKMPKAPNKQPKPTT